jgi:hypothetical protein
MSDDGNRHGHLPTEGEPNLSENGSETMENDQPGLPSWAAALTAQVTAQLQATFEAQLTQLSVARRSAPKAKNFAKRKQFFFRRSISVVCARLLRSPAGPVMDQTHLSFQRVFFFFDFIQGTKKMTD